MNRSIPVASLVALVFLGALDLAAEAPGVLVVTVTKGFRHESIADAEAVLAEIAAESGRFAVDFARTDEQLAGKMSAEGLRRYGVVIFANTTGELPLPDRDALLDWIDDGGGFLGVHSASDTFHGYPAYLEMLGGEFLTHGPITTVTCSVERRHPSTRHLQSPFVVMEEIYEFTRFDPKRVVTLMHLDRHPQTQAPGFYPLAWWRIHGHGRVLYTALGHRPETWRSDWFRRHLSGAIEWLLADPGRRRPVRR